MGAQHSAYITVDRLGAPRCAGGICATARDLARIGQVVADAGACEGRQIIPAAWIDDIAQSGSADAWDAGVFAPFFPGRRMHYRNKWYADLGEAPLLFALGIHGQYLFVDRRNQLVIVMMSSQSKRSRGRMRESWPTAASRQRWRISRPSRRRATLGS
jgi:CubicO group peptidase (beta-lactamase class C family)